MTSAVQLPDGRRFFSFGDTDYYDLAADGRAGRSQGFGNNSAWVQSGRCFELLDRAGPGNRQLADSAPARRQSVLARARPSLSGRGCTCSSPACSSIGPSADRSARRSRCSTLPSLQLARDPIRSRSRPGASSATGAVYDDGYVYAYASERGTCAILLRGRACTSRACVRDLVSVPSAWRYRSGASWVARRERGAAGPDGRGQHHQRAALRQRLPARDQAAEHRRSHTSRRGGRRIPIGPWRDLGSVFTVPLPPPSYVAGFTYQHVVHVQLVVIVGTHLHRRRLPGVVQREHVRSHRGAARRPPLRARFLLVHVSRRLRRHAPARAASR